MAKSLQFYLDFIEKPKKKSSRFLQRLTGSPCRINGVFWKLSAVCK